MSETNARSSFTNEQIEDLLREEKVNGLPPQTDKR